MFVTLKKYFLTIFVAISLLATHSINANEVSVEKAVFKFNGSSWSVDVTLKHKDAGWEHYADAWRVIDAKGKEIKKRTLHHPHVKQPFTRNLSGVKIPENTTVVYIEAHDTSHKWSSTKLKIDLVNNKSGSDH